MTKQILLSILLLIFIFRSFSQTVERTQLNRVSFDPSGKIYNKHTGEKISDEEFVAYISDNPNVNFDHEINKFGQVEKYLLDTANRSSVIDPETKELKAGEIFPEFVFKTIAGKQIKSAKLQGKWIILRFENYLRFDSLSTIKFDQQVAQHGNKEELVVISCFQEGKTEILKKINISLSKTSIVPEAYNFHLKYNIAPVPTTLPTTIVIDPRGLVFGYFYPDAELDLGVLQKK